MKRCPVCNNTFDDPYLSFCPNDGTPLQRVTANDPAATVLIPPSSQTGPSSGGNIPPAPQPYGWANDTPAQWMPPPPPSIRGPISQQQTLAAASLILGLLAISIGWICGGPFLALLAVGLGIVALVQVKKDPSRYGGKVMAIIGLVLGAVVLAAYLVFVAIWIVMMLAGAVSQ